MAKNQYKKEPLKNNVEEMFIGPFGSSLKNECFVDEEDAYCMVYEQKHAIQKTLDGKNRFVDKNKYYELKRFTIKPGDIIVSCRGTIGETFIVPENAPLGIMHPSIMKIRLKPNVYNIEYFNLLLKNRLKDYNKSANGSGIKMAISATELGKELFPIPPMDEQQKTSKIFLMVNHLMKNFPAEGWVKAGSAVDEKSVKEIARLQKENEALRKKIEKISVEAPEGTAMLKQGDDLVTLGFDYSARTYRGSYIDIVGEIDVTWNELFAEVSPILINEASESDMRGVFENLARKKPNNVTSEYSDVSVDNITDSSFGMICVQFKALGYIQLSEKKHSDQTYWSLTKYGEFVMTQLVAQRR